MTALTRIQEFDGWHAKRDDEAFATDMDSPSGSKVRQFATMAAKHGNVPMIVGCSAHSAMQIYVAAAARQAGVKAIVYTPARANQTEATAYAKRLGAELHEERPAYLNVIQSRASKHAKTLKDGYVRWNEEAAIQDAANQTDSILLNPLGKLFKRIVIPTGSGLTAAGVLAGLYRIGIRIPILCVAVSPMAKVEEIVSLAEKNLEGKMKIRKSAIKLVRAPQKYDQWHAAVLPDGTPLDPYYAAKALAYVKPGDLFWIPGVRPLSAMPDNCVIALKRLQDG